MLIKDHDLQRLVNTSVLKGDIKEAQRLLVVLNLKTCCEFCGTYYYKNIGHTCAYVGGYL